MFYRMDEAADAIDDSEDEVDYTKMDQGNKKGPIGRWDFDTQEEYSDYMANKEALPKYVNNLSCNVRKHTFRHLHQAKIQTRLGIPALIRIFTGLILLKVSSCGQRRLIWVFIGHVCQKALLFTFFFFFFTLTV